MLRREAGADLRGVYRFSAAETPADPNGGAAFYLRSGDSEEPRAVHDGRRSPGLRCLRSSGSGLADCTLAHILQLAVLNVQLPALRLGVQAAVQFLKNIFDDTSFAVFLADIFYP